MNAGQLGEDPRVLPSAQAAANFIEGRPGAAVEVVATVAARALIIAGGLFVAGERKRLLPYSLAGAVAIEIFVLASVRNALEKR